MVEAYLVARDANFGILMLKTFFDLKNYPKLGRLTSESQRPMLVSWGLPLTSRSPSVVVVAHPGVIDATLE